MSKPTSRLPAAEGSANAVTTWLPLTTVYPLVPRCTEAFYSPDNLTYIYAFDPNENAASFETHCLPDVVTSWWDQNATTGATTSLGPFLCPQAYTVAVTSTVGTSSTLTGCCPSGYAFHSLMSQAAPGGCTSSFTSGQTITYAAPSPANTNSYFTTSTVLGEDHVVQAVQVNGYNFEGNSAFPTYTGFSSVSSSAPTSSLISTSSSTQPSSSGSSSAAQSSTAASTGISTATKVGIAVGVSAGVIVVGAIIGIFLFRMRKSPYQKTPRTELDGAATPPEFKMGTNPPAVRVHEMNGDGAVETETGRQYMGQTNSYQMAEMDGAAQPVDKGPYNRY
ncbi:hypothetical protein ACMFMF_006393 [Clarireedia jacksonii]